MEKPAANHENLGNIPCKMGPVSYVGNVGLHHTVWLAGQFVRFLTLNKVTRMSGVFNVYVMWEIALTVKAREYM